MWRDDPRGSDILRGLVCRFLDGHVRIRILNGAQIGLPMELLKPERPVSFVEYEVDSRRQRPVGYYEPLQDRVATPEPGFGPARRSCSVESRA